MGDMLARPAFACQALSHLTVSRMAISSAIMFYGVRFAPSYIQIQDESGRPPDARRDVIQLHWMMDRMGLAWLGVSPDAAVACEKAEISGSDWDRRPRPILASA